MKNSQSFDKAVVKSDKSSLKKMLLAFFAFCITDLCIYFLIIYVNYFSKHGFYATIEINNNLRIDALGALTPAIIGFVCIILYFGYFRFSIKEFSAYFISLVLIGLGVFHYTLKAVSGSPVIFALIASLLLNILIFKKGSKLGGKKKLIMSVLLNLSLVPFSVLIVDLYFLPRYQSVTIGGGGALDSILVSTLWAVLITMSIILVLLFFENSGLNEKFSVAKKGSQKEIS